MSSISLATARKIDSVIPSNLPSKSDLCGAIIVAMTYALCKMADAYDAITPIIRQWIEDRKTCFRLACNDIRHARDLIVNAWKSIPNHPHAYPAPMLAVAFVQADTAPLFRFTGFETYPEALPVTSPARAPHCPQDATEEVEATNPAMTHEVSSTLVVEALRAEVVEFAEMPEIDEQDAYLIPALPEECIPSPRNTATDTVTLCRNDIAKAQREERASHLTLTPDYASLSSDELRECCEAAGYSCKGSDKVLISRLTRGGWMMI